MLKEKRKNYKGENVDIDVVPEEETCLSSEQYNPNSKITLQDALAKGHKLLEDFDKQLRNGKRSNSTHNGKTRLVERNGKTQ